MTIVKHQHDTSNRSGLPPITVSVSKLGSGHYADILIVDGNPLEDITVIGGNTEWFTAPPREKGIASIRVIMKDGKFYKNTLN